MKQEAAQEIQQPEAAEEECEPPSDPGNHSRCSAVALRHV